MIASILISVAILGQMDAQSAVRMYQNRTLSPEERVAARQANEAREQIALEAVARARAELLAHPKGARQRMLAHRINRAGKTVLERRVPVSRLAVTAPAALGGNAVLSQGRVKAGKIVNAR
jgi:hypothetical protein